MKPAHRVSYISLAPDGSIYLELPSPHTFTSIRDYYTLQRGQLLRLFPDMEEIVSVEYPEGELPAFSGLFVDDFGRLWLGAIGYLDLDADWTLLISDPESYLDRVSNFYEDTPTPVLEDSTGRVWFQNFVDGVNDGTAWFDPIANQGCLITDYPTNVIEDVQQKLWIVVDGILYRHSLVE